MEAIAIRWEAIAVRLEATAFGLESIALLLIRLEATSCGCSHSVAIGVASQLGVAVVCGVASSEDRALYLHHLCPAHTVLVLP